MICMLLLRQTWGVFWKYYLRLTDFYMLLLILASFHLEDFLLILFLRERKRGDGR